MTNLLFNKLAAVRRKLTLVSAAQGLSAIAGLAILLLALTMTLDYYLELPYFLRAALLAIDISALTYVLLWSVLAPLLFGPDNDDLALLVERALPQFRTRLIASIQLAHPAAIPAHASQSIVQAMIRQTEDLSQPLDFTKVIKTDSLLKTASLAALILLLGASAFVYGGQASTALLQRAFLANTEVPRKTRVTSLTESQTVAIGDNIALEALAKGAIPSYGYLHLSYDSGRKQTFTIDPTPDHPDRFSRLIENVQESFTYYISLNDGKTKAYTITAVPRPAVAAADFQQVYPAYTRRPPERRSPGDLTLLAGSQLHLKLQSSKPVKAGLVHLVGLEKNIPLTVTGQNRTELTGVIDIPPKDLAGFALRLTDDHGIASKGETIYPIDLVLDKEPTIKITWPDRKDELATEQARLMMGFEATDYYGIAKILLHYRVDRQLTPDSTVTGDEKTIELDLSSLTPAELRLLRKRHEFDLAKLTPKPTESSIVTYWLEVQDANTVTGPGKALSDTFQAKIVSEIAKRDELMHRLNDQLSTVDFVTQDQEKLNQNLGALILEK
jgi:hypothetical protein